MLAGSGDTLEWLAPRCCASPGCIGTDGDLRCSGSAMFDVPGVEFIDPVDESQSINERGGSGATSPSLRARCSSWVWARRRAVCRAMTRCRSAVRQHFSQLQTRYLQ